MNGGKLSTVLPWVQYGGYFPMNRYYISRYSLFGAPVNYDYVPFFHERMTNNGTRS